MRHRLSLLVACLAALASAAGAYAEVNVGDKPSFEFPLYNSDETLSNEDLRGKWVTIFFWSANSRESLTALRFLGNPAAAQEQAQAVAGLLGMDLESLGLGAEMAAELEAWQEGQVVIAVCIDEGRRDRNVRRAVEQSNFTGRVAYDTEETGRQIAQDWGITQVPAIVQLTPTGEAAFVQKPGQMLTFDAFGRLFELALRYPAMQEGQKEAAEQQLADADAALNAGDQQSALQALDGFPKHVAEYFDELGKRYRDIAARLNPMGERELEQVRATAEAGKLEEARARLRELAEMYGSLPVGQTMRDELKRLNFPPIQARRQAAQELQARVASMTARAEQLIAAGRRVDAHRKRSFIVERCPYTKATERTRALLEQLSSDPSFQREQAAERTRRVSERLLAEADELLAQGDVAAAREKWKQIIEQFPGSDFANTAQEKLDKSR